MNVVLIETSGNQRFIFATNKLRENVGASELTYQVGTRIVVEEVGRSYDYSADNDQTLLRELLLSEKPIELASDKDAIEIVIATSGKAILLTNSRDKAEEIIRKVTTRALIEMPGLTVQGAIETVRDDLADIHRGVRDVHRRFEKLRHKIPNNQQRFLRLPYVEPCATSGLPASEIITFRNVQGTNKHPFSQVTSAKRKALAVNKKNYANDDRFAKARSTTLLEEMFAVPLSSNLERLQDAFPNLKWLAVIHADGNGLGDIFSKLADHLGIERNPDDTFKSRRDAREYLDAYRQFSLDMDQCTIEAFGHALRNLQLEVTRPNSNHSSSGEVPVVPLILGGDDLTCLCDGEYALKLTHDFLGEFERQVSANQSIWRIANSAFGNKDENNPSIKRFGICAGVAIVKPHYPFHQAYELAEQLLKSAKQVKTRVKHVQNGDEVSLPCSAMDFHILYDSSGVELNEIREKLQVEAGQTYLYAKPYIVTEMKETPLDATWLTPRTWNNLSTRVYAMSAKDDDGKRRLPNSQMHHIRKSLHRGQRETDSEMNLFNHRYEDKGFDKLLCQKDNPKSLFFSEKHNKNGIDTDGHATHFLDALDVVEFWNGFRRDDGSEDSESGGKP